MTKWRKIVLFIDILTFILIFIYKDYILLTVLLFILFSLYLIPWNKKYAKNALLFGCFFFIIGTIPFLADKICRSRYSYNNLGNKCVNLFELPWRPVFYFTEKILGFTGEKNMVVLVLAPLIYIFLGALSGVLIGKKNE